MGLMAQRHARVAWAVLGLALLTAAIDGVQLARVQRWNAEIAAGAPKASADSPPPLRFAQAHAQAASGAAESALNRYAALQDESPLGQAARFNAANLLMRQAIEMRSGAQPGQALALIELAKEHYRDVLRRDPADWNARYNLERAQRLVPDPDEAEAAPPESQRSAERAATMMRGFSPGMP